jgi:hypothetical protein
MTIGITRDVRSFASSDCFAAYNGTAPIEARSGSQQDRHGFKVSVRNWFALLSEAWPAWGPPPQ